MSTFVSTQEQLEHLVDELSGSEYLAIDTEFLREKTYYAKLCLVQVNNGEVSALIDPLVVDDLHPFGRLLADRGCTKVFHAGSQDIDILYHATGVTPTPLFDTQVAAAMLGYPLQVGYGPLVRSVCDVKLAKADSFTDWSRRPLTDHQLRYALDDVTYLPQIYLTLAGRLEKLGRLSWLAADFEELADPGRYERDPREMWRRVKRISSLNRSQLAIVREVAAWRERVAMRRDVPRKWVMSDEAIVEVARKAPNTSERLLEVRGLSGHLSRQAVNDVLEAVRVARELPAEARPRLERRPHGDAEVDGAVDLMAALVEVRAKQNEVAAPLLASHDELSRLARGHRDEVDVLRGWRYDMVGRELVDLLEGRLALYLDRGTIRASERS